MAFNNKVFWPTYQKKKKKGILTSEFLINAWLVRWLRVNFSLWSLDPTKCSHLTSEVMWWENLKDQHIHTKYEYF